MLTEVPRSSLLRKTAEEWQALKEMYPMIAELQRIVAVEKMETPDVAGEVSYKYAVDRWGFMMLCGYCAGEGVTAIETANHFACCPR
jgi:hypothetical protein